MANALSEELREVQNPALVGALQWRCALGYASVDSPEPCPLILLFLVAPVILHGPSFAHVLSTQGTGLRGFVSKFGTGNDKNRDDLLSLQDRAYAMRDLSKRGIAIALATGLVVLVAGSGSVAALSETAPRSGVALETRKLLKQSEKFGRWLRPLSLLEIASTLKVRL